MFACALALGAFALGPLRTAEAQGFRGSVLTGDSPQRSVGRIPFSTRRLAQMIDDDDDEAEEDGGNDDDVAPAPASIGTDVPLSYFGALRHLVPGALRWVR